MSCVTNKFNALSFDSDSDVETNTMSSQPQKTLVSHYIDNDALVLCYKKKSSFNKTIYQGKYKETMKSSKPSYKNMLSSRESKKIYEDMSKKSQSSTIDTNTSNKPQLTLQNKNYDDYQKTKTTTSYDWTQEQKVDKEYIEEMESVMSDGEFQEWYADYVEQKNGYEYGFQEADNEYGYGYDSQYGRSDDYGAYEDDDYY